MAKKNIKLSVAIAVYNEEKNIEACLASVNGLADEIIVVDGGSGDATVAIARKFTSRIIETDNPPMFHINKQKALDACAGDWILQLDADERVTPALKKEIREVINSGSSDVNGYFIPRKNYFWGHWMRKGGQYPDYVIRLVRRGKAHFPAKSVHEQIEIVGEPGYLTEPMDHISYRTKADYWRKAESYTSLAATQMKRDGVVNNPWTWLTYNMIKPQITFLSLLIRHKGFMDRWYGIVFAYFSALHFPITYRKFVKL